MIAAHAEPIRDPALDEAAPYRLGVPAYEGWLSSNDNRAGKLFYARAKVVSVWRQTAHDQAVKSRVPALGQVRVIAECCFRDRRHRDPANYTDTAKAAIDGLVDAGVVVDDSAAYVLGPDLRLGPVLSPGTVMGAGLLVLHLYPLGEVTP
jgi:crossover junction endodeoxyribonuclease RusA